jgi:hypothetical protein
MPTVALDGVKCGIVDELLWKSLISTMIRRLTVYPFLIAALFALSRPANSQGRVPDRHLGDWDPSVLTTQIPTAKLLFTGSEFYGPYSGRSIEVRQGVLGSALNSWLYVWGNSQRYTIKGRASNSRMRLSTSSYGFKAQIRKPDANGDYGATAQFEIYEATNAKVIVAQSRVTYGGTAGESANISVDLPRGISSRVGFTESHNSSDGQALAFNVGAAKSYAVSNSVTVRGQADLIFQSWRSSADGSRRGLEIKPLLNIGAGYKLNKWASLESDVTLMPLGVPYYAGHLTSLGSFLFYEPAGVAGELRSKAVGYGGLYLVLKWNR